MVLSNLQGVEKYKGCLPGWLHYKDVCYFIKGGHVSYDTAKSECDNLGGKLAAVDTTAHLDFVHSQLHISKYSVTDRESPWFITVIFVIKNACLFSTVLTFSDMMARLHNSRRSQRFCLQSNADQYVQ